MSSGAEFEAWDQSMKAMFGARAWCAENDPDMATADLARRMDITRRFKALGVAARDAADAMGKCADRIRRDLEETP